MGDAARRAARSRAAPQPRGLEIEAHSAYAPGDDLRHLDWNLLGRLDALLMRRFTAEREVVVHLLLDASASMARARRRRQAGRRLASWRSRSRAIAIASRHAVRLVVLRGDGRAARRRRAPPARGARRHGRPARRHARPAEPLDLGRVLGEYAHRHREGGAALVVSDFLRRARAGSSRASRRCAGAATRSTCSRCSAAASVEPGARARAAAACADVESGAHPRGRAHARRPGALRRAARRSIWTRSRALAARQRATWTSCASDTPVRRDPSPASSRAPAWCGRR